MGGGVAAAFASFLFLIFSRAGIGATSLPPLPPSVRLSVNSSAPRPNVLIFLIDDMGYSDLASFGAPNVSTPHIDALAASGLKFTQWISGAPICTPSRASFQTGRYAIRTGCIGNVERYRVIPTPSNPHGLDPRAHVSLGRALKEGGYATGLSGKWHLGINSAALGAGSMAQDRRWTPIAHGYDTYLGAPWTNAPMCAMDSDGRSEKFKAGPTFCFLTANDTVVEQPLRVENFTRTITAHALDFLDAAAATPTTPWLHVLAFFHVHTPLFVNRANRGRSAGGEFGDNVEELDDAVGLVLAKLDALAMRDETLIFLTSDNGPYQEEGWAHAGRSNVYAPQARGGRLVGRLKGGKGQFYEGGVRMPGVVSWAKRIPAGLVSSALVSTIDIFPTVLALAGVELGTAYVVDGRDMAPVLLGSPSHARNASAAAVHPDVFLQWCGFTVVAARVWGRWKVHWYSQKWYTHDAMNSSICLECCNGINPYSKLVGAPATELCGCAARDLVALRGDAITVYDVETNDVSERLPLTRANWPGHTAGNVSYSYDDVVAAANATRDAIVREVHPTPDSSGAGTCTAGLPAVGRQPCCPGCAQPNLASMCQTPAGAECRCG